MPIWVETVLAILGWLVLALLLGLGLGAVIRNRNHQVERDDPTDETEPDHQSGPL